MGLYNRYIPSEEYVPVEPPQGEHRQSEGGAFSGLFGQLSSVLSFFSGEGKNAKNAGSTGILGKFGLDKLDKGDILLVLILIYLFRESEDDEWLIILALVLLMGL